MLALIPRALGVALVVGSVLLMINQHAAFFGDADLDWMALVLTYCVPFFVFIYGSLGAKSPSGGV